MEQTGDGRWCRTLAVSLRSLMETTRGTGGATRWRFWTRDRSWVYVTEKSQDGVG